MKFNPEYSSLVIKLRRFKARKNKSDYKELKSLIIHRFKVSKISLWRHLKQPVPGLRKHTEIKAELNAEFQKLKEKLAVELLLSGRTVKNTRELITESLQKLKLQTTAGQKSGNLIEEDLI